MNPAVTNPDRARRLAGNARINGRRLWDCLEDMAKIGATPKGGVNRQALTDLDRQSRDLFARWCEEAGLTVRIDRLGNMFARRSGMDDTLAPVMMGSHLDTQPTGGKYDGALGVLAALECMRTLNDLGVRTKRPIDIVNWTNEEGARFAPAMVASAAFAGIYSEDYVLERQDSAEKTFGAELSRIGFVGAEPVGGQKIHALFELHIEQGPILEAEGCDIGIVVRGQGMKWYDIVLTGFESHAGSTPMPRRRDALAAAARVIEAVRRIALSESPDGVGTVGALTIAAPSRNVIPGQVSLTAEFRHPTADALLRMDQALRPTLAKIAAEEKVDCAVTEIFDCAPTIFDPACLALCRKAAKDLALSHRDIVSGAGHDACNIARIAPTAMIFTPCVDGISHNEAERIHPHWAENGANVLLLACLEAAQIEA